MSARLSLVGQQANDGAASRNPPPIGQILVESHALDEAQLTQALSDAGTTGRRVGEVLVAEGIVSEETVAAALATQFGLGVADIANAPQDPALADPDDLDTYLAYRLIPWRQMGGMTLFATADPARASEGLGALASRPVFAFVVVATPSQIQDAILAGCGPALAQRAATRLPAQQSVRSLTGARWRTALIALSLLIGLFAVGVAPLLLLAVPLAVLSVATTGVRLAALVASAWPDPPPPPVENAPVRLADRRPLPRISLLVPLYHEAGMLPEIVRSLDAIDYPRALLDVKILLEASDKNTISAAEEADLPAWIQPLVVPDGQPRTKPRALNAALDFCDGDIIGILDAEDRPAAGQLRDIADHLRNAPPTTACVQCQLSYFNARENWIARCFQIEYSIWFDVLLRGFQRLGLPIPLGGTSVYLRRSAIADLEGWDAHNVTEDADLGMRLARRGFRTAVLTSTTEEEANCRALPWIRQRSRWLKGYILTWISHMRQPIQLWRDLGPAGVFGLNVLFLGGAVTYLAMPLFWFALIKAFWGGQAVFAGVLPDQAATALGWTLGIGQAVMIACAALALRRRGALDLLAWLPVLPVYWTLGALAAWKAVIEVIAAPYYWDKTRHGVTRQAHPVPPPPDGS